MALRAVAAATRSGLMLGVSGAVLGTTVAACADDNKMFDPEALERGAKALREIQNSPYAKKASGRCRWWDMPPPLPPPAPAASPCLTLGPCFTPAGV
jgi:hypothetical protein